ncbi:MAG: DUF309 domain-containing protein [Thaumarchaeota archaeon]|nr:DUF309 domain-containing protein [Nitrososphaerota archaeon]
MRFLVRLRATKVPREHLLETARTVARTLGLDPRNPKWTSYGALELDVFSPTTADFDLFVVALSPLAEFEFTKDLGAPPRHRSDDDLFGEARSLFNAERYWECHEVLEGVWRQRQGEDKRLLQGVILVCAAFVHHQKQEEEVALGVLRRSLPLLDTPRGEVAGIRLSSFRRHVQDAIGSGKLVDFRV